MLADLPSLFSHRPTQPGHPTVGRYNEYRQLFRLPLEKKRWIFHSSRPCSQDCSHTGLFYASLSSSNPCRLKRRRGWASSRLTLRKSYALWNSWLICWDFGLSVLFRWLCQILSTAIDSHPFQKHYQGNHYTYSLLALNLVNLVGYSCFVFCMFSVCPVYFLAFYSDFCCF